VKKIQEGRLARPKPLKKQKKKRKQKVNNAIRNPIARHTTIVRIKLRPQVKRQNW